MYIKLPVDIYFFRMKFNHPQYRMKRLLGHRIRIDMEVVPQLSLEKILQLFADTGIMFYTDDTRG